MERKSDLNSNLLSAPYVTRFSTLSFSTIVETPVWFRREGGGKNTNKETRLDSQVGSTDILKSYLFHYYYHLNDFLKS